MTPIGTRPTSINRPLPREKPGLGRNGDRRGRGGYRISGRTKIRCFWGVSMSPGLATFAALVRPFNLDLLPCLRFARQIRLLGTGPFFRRLTPSSQFLVSNLCALMKTEIQSRSLRTEMSAWFPHFSPSVSFAKPHPMKNAILTILGLTLFASASQAANVVSAQSGNWSATSTWVGGAVPTASDTVTIADTHTVTIDTTALALTVTVGQGASGSLVWDSDHGSHAHRQPIRHDFSRGHVSICRDRNNHYPCAVDRNRPDK